jgi:hypothetical protein
MKVYNFIKKLFFIKSKPNNKNNRSINNSFTQKEDEDIQRMGSMYFEASDFHEDCGDR